MCRSPLFARLAAGCRRRSRADGRDCWSVPRAPLALLALLLAFLLGALPAQPAGRTPVPDGPALRIAGVDYIGDLPTLVAEQEGLFAAAGLTVSVTRNLSGRDNLRQLLAGEVDFALMALTPLVLHQLQRTAPPDDQTPVILASLVHTVHITQVVAIAGRGIAHPADLSGRRVGLMPGTNAELLWWLFAAYHGLDPDQVEQRNFPVSALPAALLAGVIDAAVLWEPWTARLHARLGADLLLLPGSDIYTAKWILVTTRGLVRRQPAQCRAVLAAYRAAIGRIDQDPAAALALYAATVGIAPALLDPFTALFGLSLDWSLLATLQQEVAWARAVGVVPAGTATDLLSWLEPAPLRALAPTLVRVPAALPAGPP